MHNSWCRPSLHLTRITTAAFWFVLLNSASSPYPAVHARLIFLKWKFNHVISLLSIFKCHPITFRTKPRLFITTYGLLYDLSPPLPPGSWQQCGSAACSRTSLYLSHHCPSAPNCLSFLLYSVNCQEDDSSLSSFISFSASPGRHTVSILKLSLHVGCWFTDLSLPSLMWDTLWKGFYLFLFDSIPILNVPP